MVAGGAMRISTIISRRDRPVITITPDASVAQLASLLTQHGIGAVVVSGNRSDVEGLVSERDIVRGLHLNDSLLSQPVSSIMTNPVFCVKPDATIQHIMHFMTERRIRHIPIVDDDGKLIDIISIGDVVKSGLGELEGEREALMDYITS
jgi:CBS domain-containing protein